MQSIAKKPVIHFHIMHRLLIVASKGTGDN